MCAMTLAWDSSVLDFSLFNRDEEAKYQKRLINLKCLILTNICGEMLSPPWKNAWRYIISGIFVILFRNESANNFENCIDIAFNL